MNCLIVFLCTFFGIATFSPLQPSPALILTPYIERNDTVSARNASRVDPNRFLNVSSHSGFLTVDVVKNTNLFFWYFPVEKKPLNTTPWIVWLQGGPGATSLAGLFLEIGPFEYKNELKLREWSWSKEYSLLFIDSPVGAGYSFTSSPDGFVTNMDECSKHLYGALQQFLELFPEHRHAPLYLAGESYAGHFIPALAHRILHPPQELHRSSLKDISINLKGLMLGNPMIDRRDEIDISLIYYHWGLIDRQGLLAIQPLQRQYRTAIEKNNSAAAYKLRNDLIDTLSDLTDQNQTYNLLKDDMDLQHFIELLKKPEIAKAIHVGHKEFTFSNREVHVKLIPDFLERASTHVEELLEHYKILIFCGQVDLTVPYVPNAEARRKNWRWSHRDDFLKSPRLPWLYNGSLAGYVKSGGGLTEVLVRGAGHLVPLDKPAEVMEMITDFINGLNLPSPTQFKETKLETPTYTEENVQREDKMAPSESTKESVTTSSSQSKNGMVASAVLNVILVIIIILGIVYWVRWKRRTETYYYDMVDNSSLNDAVLTMN